MLTALEVVLGMPLGKKRERAEAFVAAAALRIADAARK
jgi:hypothetical protein